MSGNKKAGNDPLAYLLTKIQTDLIRSNQTVPGADSALNVLIRDVIGNKLDTHVGDSIYALLILIEEHLHYTPMVYPLLADPVTLAKAVAAAWAAFPTPTEIIPAGTITKDFDLHNANVSRISAAGDYVFALYSGDAGSEVLIGVKPVSRSAINAQEGQIILGSILIPANTRISGAVSSGNAALDEIDIKLEYHTY